MRDESIISALARANDDLEKALKELATWDRGGAPDGLRQAIRNNRVAVNGFVRATMHLHKAYAQLGNQSLDVEEVL